MTMTKADPEDLVDVASLTDEAASEGVSSQLSGPLGVVLGLMGAVATGFFLSEESPPPGPKEPMVQSGPAMAGRDQADPDANATGLAGPSGFTPGQRPAGMAPMAPEIIVKFKDGGPIKEICDLFWKDKEAARSAFAEFASDKPFLQGLHLKRATYSNELVLELHPERVLQLSPVELRARYVAATKLLRDSSMISYAEPNAAAQPGEGAP